MSAQADAVSAESAIARAEELIPVLAERAAQCEELRQVPDETIADLKSAGLLRLMTPERFGGPGFDFDAAWEVGYRLGQGCPSTAWVYMVSQVHAYQIGVAPLATQEEYFADPDVMSSSAFAPTGKVELVDGGWMIHGIWPFSSGADHAAWYLLGAIVPGRGHGLSMVPASDAEIVDDWFVSGLRGTGSKTLRIDEPVFVPERRFLPVAGDGSPEMRDLHRRPSYGSPLPSMVGFTLLSALVGMAQGAVDTFAAQAQRRRLRGKPVHELEAVQVRLALAAQEVDAAATLCRSLLREHAERGAAGDAWSVADRMRYRMYHGTIAAMAVSVANRLFDGAGGSALYDVNAMQRFHRDIHAGSHQAGLNLDDIAPMVGRVRLGLAPDNPMW